MRPRMVALTILALAVASGVFVGAWVFRSDTGTGAPAGADTTIPLAAMDVQDFDDPAAPQEAIRITDIGTQAGYVVAGDPGTMCGRVVNATGAPVAHAAMRFWGTAGTFPEEPVHTGADGMACATFWAPAGSGRLWVTLEAAWDGRTVNATKSVEVVAPAQTAQAPTVPTGIVLVAVLAGTGTLRTRPRARDVGPTDRL